MKRVLFLLLMGMVLISCSSQNRFSLTAVRNPEKVAEYNTELGISYYKLGDLQRANIKLEKALQFVPDYAPAHNAYGVLQHHLGQAKKAEKHFKIALRKEPLNSLFLSHYGVFLYDHGRIEAALRKFMQALKDPLYKEPESYTYTGICMIELKQYNQAESYFRKALKLKPDYHKALYQMAVVNEYKQEYHLAWAYIERYHEILDNKKADKKTADSLWMTVRLARRLNYRDAEAKFSVQLKSRYPDSQQTADMMKRFK